MTGKITKRTIQIALGLLWLLDGALQLQRQMFTSHFANQVIAPNAQGQPVFVRGPIHLAIHIILMHPAVWDCLFAIIQLSLGVLILYKRTARYGLLASVVWGLGVWYIGEGLGGLLNGNASLLAGTPGAALLYAILAIGVMPSKSSHTAHSNKPATWLAIVWVIVWLGGAMLQLGQGQNNASELASMISGMSSGAPGWLASLDMSTSRFLSDSGAWVIPVLVITQAVIGILVLLPHFWRKLALLLGIIVALGFWALGQGFGTYYTGLATDPNTAPLIILLSLAVWGSQPMKLEIF